MKVIGKTTKLEGRGGNGQVRSKKNCCLLTAWLPTGLTHSLIDCLLFCIWFGSLLHISPAIQPFSISSNRRVSVADVPLLAYVECLLCRVLWAAALHLSLHSQSSDPCSSSSPYPLHFHLQSRHVLDYSMLGRCHSEFAMSVFVHCSFEFLCPSFIFLICYLVKGVCRSGYLRVTLHWFDV